MVAYKVGNSFDFYPWGISYGSSYYKYGTFVPVLTGEYAAGKVWGAGGSSGGATYGKVSADRKTMYWYATAIKGTENNGPGFQLNVSAYTYHWIAFG